MSDSKEFDDQAEEQVENPKPIPFYKKKKIWIVTAAGIALAGVSLYFTQGLWKGLIFKPSPMLEASAQKEQAGKTVYFDVSNIVVNLRQTQKNKKPVYLKLSVMMELNNQSEHEILHLMRPKIIDQFQVYLRELTVEDLSAAEGGLQRLREELLIRINTITAPLKVKDILFKDVLIQ